jgi:hypothetical protein
VPNGTLGKGWGGAKRACLEAQSTTAAMEAPLGASNGQFQQGVHPAPWNLLGQHGVRVHR